VTDFYYEGPIVLSTYYESGPLSTVWLKWADGDGDLATSLIEALGLDEESMAESGKPVEVHARVRVSFDPYRARLRGEGQST
jgi:hypothetical protein